MFSEAAFSDTPFLSTKLISTLALLILTLACSYLPWVVNKKFKNSKIIMSYFNCLAGGVILGALLMHMIPEIVDSHGHGVAVHAHNHLHSHSHGHCHGEHHVHTDKCSHDQGKSPEKSKKSVPNKEAAMHGGHSAHDPHSHGFAWGPFFAGVSFLLLMALDRLFMHSHSHDHEHNSSPSLDHPEKAPKRQDHTRSLCQEPDCSETKIVIYDPEIDDCASCHSEDLMGGCHMDAIDHHTSQKQAMIFVIALSVHSFLEGLGMATKNTQESLSLFLISLFAHKWLEAFALGVNVLTARFSTSFTFSLLTIYALLTPIGIILGIVFERLTVESAWASFTVLSLNGLAVGSFLFVSCIEIIPPEFHKKTLHTKYKFIALSLGFLMMALLSKFHSH